jgi:hypothetical protein
MNANPRALTNKRRIVLESLANFIHSKTPVRITLFLAGLLEKCRPDGNCCVGM